jgi:glycosyltransferase involved in cell wall biosynthesis
VRISFVEPHLEIYGGIRRVLEFSNRFVARGEEVTIYHPTGEKCAWMRCEADTRTLERFFGDDHDVVIFNNPPDYKLVRKCRAGLKVFYVLALYERDQLTRFNPKIWWPRKGRMLSLKRALQLPFLKVANATWIKRWLKQNMNIDSHLQLGGINRELFHPVKSTRDSSAFRILCSGDPRTHKGTATIAEAVDLVRKTHPDIELSTYHGKGIPQELMAACYSGADLFVDAQWYAGWNNPVVEAMACGTAVVCTDIGGVGDFAFLEKTALLVPVRDPVSLASAIRRMIDDPELRRSLAANALEHVSRFDWDTASERFLDLLYREMGAERRAKPDGTGGRGR